MHGECDHHPRLRLRPPRAGHRAEHRRQPTLLHGAAGASVDIRAGARRVRLARGGAAAVQARRGSGAGGGGERKQGGGEGGGRLRVRRGRHRSIFSTV